MNRISPSHKAQVTSLNEVRVAVRWLAPHPRSEKRSKGACMIIRTYMAAQCHSFVWVVVTKTKKSQKLILKVFDFHEI